VKTTQEKMAVKQEKARERHTRTLRHGRTRHASTAARTQLASPIGAARPLPAQAAAPLPARRCRATASLPPAGAAEAPLRPTSDRCAACSPSRRQSAAGHHQQLPRGRGNAKCLKIGSASCREAGRVRRRTTSCTVNVISLGRHRFKSSPMGSKFFL
jgi:hypothetical protein